MNIPYTINHVAVEAGAKEQCVDVSMKIDLEVLKEDYLLIPLLQQNVAILDTNIKGPETMHMAVTRGSHTLLANGKGVYTIDLKLAVPYTSAIKQGVSIPCPECIDTTCVFTVPDEEVKLHVSPSVVSQQKDSMITAKLPPTKAINVKWTSSGPSLAATPLSMTTLTPPSTPGDRVSEKPEEKKPEKERVITSGQEILHSIGGGVCRSRLSQTFTVTNGNVASFQLKIGKHGSASLNAGRDWIKSHLKDENLVKIISAEGANLRSWDYTDDTITLSLDSNTEGTCCFVITAEYDLCSTSCHLYLPTFSPINVNRNKGAIAIQGRTAVEIIEGEAKYISKVDVAELPPDLKKESNVLFAFKYLVSCYRLCLDAIKHEDVEVIIALCESATYKITHTGEQLLYDLSFNIKNTQCQYAKILLPPRASVWSALVGGETVKPAVDGSGKTLLPLIKGSDVAFNATLVFITPAPGLPADKGKINSLMFTLPTIDLPITHLRTELWLPQTHIYAAFDGAIDEVKYFNEAEVLREVHNVNQYQAKFSHAVSKRKAPMNSRSRMRNNRMPLSNAYNAPQQVQQLNLQMQQQQQQMQQQMQQQQYMPQQQMMMPQQQQYMPPQQMATRQQLPHSNIMMRQMERRSSISMASIDEDDLDLDEEEDEDAPMGGMAQGIKPLKVSTDTLRKGARYLFEKLLIPSGTVLSLTTETCMAVVAEERTVQSDKGKKGCCIQ